MTKDNDYKKSFGSSTHCHYYFYCMYYVLYDGADWKGDDHVGD